MHWQQTTQMQHLMKWWLAMEPHHLVPWNTTPVVATNVMRKCKDCAQQWISVKPFFNASQNNRWREEASCPLPDTPKFARRWFCWVMQGGTHHQQLIINWKHILIKWKQHFEVSVKRDETGTRSHQWCAKRWSSLSFKRNHAKSGPSPKEENQGGGNWR